MVAILDLDGTLVDRDAGFAAWADEFCGARGLGASERSWVVALDRELVRERGRFFDELVAGFGLEEEPGALWAGYRTTMPHLVSAYPGVRDGLAALRAEGWRLAVLSNGRPDNQRGKLQVAGLLEFFETCRFSGETGLRKPDPAAFLDALDVLRVSAGAEVWMLGDDPELDIGGAAAVGLSTLWVSHGRAWPAELTGPTGSVVDPAEAFEALRTSR